MLLSITLCLSSLGCFSNDEGRQFRLPTAPGNMTPPVAGPSPDPAPPGALPPPPPLPPVHPPLSDDYHSIMVGERFAGSVPANPPECLGFRSWPCQYFRLTAPADGLLIVELTYRQEQQTGQGVDVTIYRSSGGEIWADRFAPGTVSARAPVSQGETLEVVAWYTFPGLEYEVVTGMGPR